VRHLVETMESLWRYDMTIRAGLADSGHPFWGWVALVLPFGWAFLLRRLEPVRVRVRARDW
jgi:hypothetical protein